MTPAGAERPSPDRILRDEHFMRLAIALGGRHLGLTWPNPSVGAVLVDESGDSPMILAQGVTQAGGRPHAERIALEAAGERARGATLYVTLEPCAARSSHSHGPSCSDLIVAAGIGRLVVSVPDPSPFAAGQGPERFGRAGIPLSIGCLAPEGARLHGGHITRVTRGRPAVTVKLARSTEGFAGARRGPRLMLTGEAANGRVHLMRAHADAIMVGVGTVLADDPLLNVRLPGLEGRSPVRIVVDSRLRTPPTARVVAGAGMIPTWIVTTVDAPVEPERALAARGVEILRVSSDANGRVHLPEALQLLGTRGLTGVFCEGGPDLADALARSDLVDELVLITGRSARGQGDVPALGPALQDQMDFLNPWAEEQIGPDLFMFWERP
ncbi:bifunctional diaminohydroxyphosphoribosylaminopyrimidine deaminase/5-amino-6-(5-phosphoribosylamino)uracil reductase RibD [Microvirga sp. HBU67558]|uniref:bifunctional diaminohydroxyphosphoribosylaminopyrimidine deaminase/5-amino-6-(5-phosphoribosylamino)uracil reductase RibD n=1 Tax=Microvirga TaxID=186650 RepID=UPI001B35A27A|nr:MULTISPECIES: bifunctional diaminohydroxyphosphoribosylaminopyrimidine deaminase/5-amino-6-(5-phosphoribosylamino)uracil reductase RibD [unclassified Microvirga]MBQ0824456.1 bifunctional diaminohydroxyphosphoribosylaminopyrimidine deaminase/5-amino-6-(5-phosphoribosylamino)uracil reductase RibD [Microvirga sp. HBU67558]